MRNLKNLTLCALLLALTSTAAVAAENTMAFETDWFDLETGTVIPEEFSFP